MQTSFRSNYQNGGHSLLNYAISTKVSCAVQCIIKTCNKLTLVCARARVCVYNTVFNGYVIGIPWVVRLYVEIIHKL